MDGDYQLARQVRIVQVDIHGLDMAPARVVGTSAKKSLNLDFEYSKARQSLSVKGLNVPVATGSRSERLIFALKMS